MKRISIPLLAVALVLTACGKNGWLPASVCTVNTPISVAAACNRNARSW